MKKKKGISLIVLIVTIIVIIILAAAVILTLSRNNPVESAREATFKEDVRAFQDELALSVSKEYVEKQGQRDKKITTNKFEEIKKYIPSFTEKYKDKFVIVNDKLVGTDALTEKEITWLENLKLDSSGKAPFNKEEWDKTAASEDGFDWDGTTIVGYNAELLSSSTILRIPAKCTEINLNTIYHSDGVREFVRQIEKIEIPDTCTKIGKGAFANFTSLKEIVMPDTITEIGESAFEDCTSLTSITIPESVTSLGNRAFYNCTNLSNITIPSSVTNIGTDVLYNTEYYNNPEKWENGVLYIGSTLIKASNTLSGEYNIKEGTNIIKAGAFSGCSNLTNIIIPESVTSIEGSAFYNCSSLTSITIPESVTSLGDQTFYNCSSLESVTLPSYLTEIGSYAFRDCSNLTSIIIPEGVKDIYQYAFDSCTSLTSVKLPDSLTYISHSAFINCTSLMNITLPDSVTTMGSTVFKRL